LQSGSLTTDEAKVLLMRFGTGMNTDHTLEEVGKQFDVTHEHIRQIKVEALRNCAIQHAQNVYLASSTVISNEDSLSL